MSKNLLERMYRDLWAEFQQLKERNQELEWALTLEQRDRLAEELLELLDRAQVPPERRPNWLSLERH